jgi:hypothetical protein
LKHERRTFDFRQDVSSKEHDMTTDLVLDDGGREWIALAANVINMKGADLMLDAPYRRQPGASGYRRALVHDQRDGLTVNYNQDYPGGVTINGITELVPRGWRSGTILNEGPRAVPDLVVRGGIQFIWENAGVVVGGDRHRTVTVQGLVSGLEDRIADLERRVAALEAR